MVNIFDKIVERTKSTGLPLCVGLDPHLELIPDFIFDINFKKYGYNQKAIAESIFYFNKSIIDNLKKFIFIFKPQIAFYELLGIEGIVVLKKTLDYLKKNDLIVILDGKRNDIGSTSMAYSNAYLADFEFRKIKIDNFNSDLLTVNGYTGKEGLIPFVEKAAKFNKGIFVLSKTSNKSASEIQDIYWNGKKIYELMADIVFDISKNYTGKYGFTNAGIVVAATYKETLKEMRKKYSQLFFLVPGYQAQGGNIEDIKYAFLKERIGAIVNSSRGILYAYKRYGMKDIDFIKASIKAVEEAYEEFNKILKI